MAAVADNAEAVVMLAPSGRYLGYLSECFATPYVTQDLLTPLASAAIRYEAPLDMTVRRDARRSDLLAVFITETKATHA